MLESPPMTLVGLRLSLKCPGCDAQVPILRAGEHLTTCSTCGAPIDRAGDVTLASLLRAWIGYGLTLPEGGVAEGEEVAHNLESRLAMEAASGSPSLTRRLATDALEALLAPGRHELGVRVEVKRLAPGCIACARPLSTQALDASADRPARCDGCGAALDVHLPDDDARAIDRRIRFVVGDAAAALASPSAAAVSLGCEGCGAPIAIDGAARDVACPYCRRAHHVTDALWAPVRRGERARPSGSSSTAAPPP